jgi:hypothetical protein
MVEGLLRHRRDQAIEYSAAAAAALLEKHFDVVMRDREQNGTRTLYHCRPKTPETR